MIETTLAVTQTYTVKLNNQIVHALGVSSILHNFFFFYNHLIWEKSEKSDLKMTLSNT